MTQSDIKLCRTIGHCRSIYQSGEQNFERNWRIFALMTLLPLDTKSIQDFHFLRHQWSSTFFRPFMSVVSTLHSKPKDEELWDSAEMQIQMNGYCLRQHYLGCVECKISKGKKQEKYKWRETKRLMPTQPKIHLIKKTGTSHSGRPKARQSRKCEKGDCLSPPKRREMQVDLVELKAIGVARVPRLISSNLQ